MSKFFDIFNVKKCKTIENEQEPILNIDDIASSTSNSEINDEISDLGSLLTGQIRPILKVSGYNLLIRLMSVCYTLPYIRIWYDEHLACAYRL